MNNTVTFKVAGSDVLSFMDQIKKKADTLTSEMIANAKKQGVVAKDQLKDIELQIKALERKNRLEVESARGMIAAQKENKIGGYKDDLQRKIKEIHDDPNLTRFEKSAKVNNFQAGADEKVAGAEQEYKDQLKILREQERQESLQTKLLRDNVETIKSTSNQQVQQMRRGDTDIIDELDDQGLKDPQVELANRFAKEKHGEEQSTVDDKLTAKKMFGLMLAVEGVKDLMKSVSQFSSTENGFDLIRPASKTLGTMLGGLLGGAVGTLIAPGAGTLIGGGIGASIGGGMGDTVGEFQQRRGMAAQDFLSSKFKLEATSQKDVSNITDTHLMGVSASEYLTILRQIAVNTGSMVNAAQNTNNTIALEKGLGVDKGTSAQMITYFRGTTKDIGNLVQGIMTKGQHSMFAGGDMTFLNEFLQHFNQLHNELRATTEKVSTGTTFDILSTFDKIGGQFGAKDPRSMGLINNVQNALVNPASDSVNALSFLALRQSNPKMDIAQLLEERQKGLGSPAYLKSMFQYVDQLGGDHAMKVMNTAGVFGLQGNMAAARRLYDNRDKIGTMSKDEIEEKYLSVGLDKKAESKTTVIEQNMTDIKNGLLGTWVNSLDAMVNSFRAAMGAAFSGATIKMANGSISFNGAGNMSSINADEFRQNKARTNKKDVETVIQTANALKGLFK